MADRNATAEYFFARGEAGVSLRHLASIHADECAKVNMIDQIPGKVNAGASAEIRRYEYLSAVKCADTAAAMSLPPVLGKQSTII